MGINPQVTIGAMADDMRAFGDLSLRMGFEVIHNRTEVPSLTSDNPICYFNPSASIDDFRPYAADDEIEFLFPLDAQTLLRGSHQLEPRSLVTGYGDLAVEGVVHWVNRITARFGYRWVLARRREDDLVGESALTSPVLVTSASGEPTESVVHYGHVFGPPRPSTGLSTPRRAPVSWRRKHGWGARRGAVLSPTAEVDPETEALRIC